MVREPLIEVQKAAHRRTRGAQPHTLGAAMNDLLVIGMTVVIFGALFLLVKAVEHLER